ncbi:hypothetical protein [Thermogutta sp.]|uniref:hypothetical protein n=1 Tax=Thermogutta sp. TaxID=1962930 RepID=UPI003C7D27FB
MAGSSHGLQDESNQNLPSRWHLLWVPIDVAAMQAGQTAGMSGTSLSVTGSGSSSSQAAVIGPPLELSDPPLRARVLDEPKFILPTGPVFELLRPA